jgi:hypothetical protein
MTPPEATLGLFPIYFLVPAVLICVAWEFAKDLMR